MNQNKTSGDQEERRKRELGMQIPNPKPSLKSTEHWRSRAVRECRT